MTTAEFFEILSILLLSGTKMAFAPPLALGLKYSTFETMGLVGLGAVIGLFFFYFAGNIVHKGIKKIRHKIRPQTNKPRIMTRMNRFIVRVRRKTGIIGIAIITPTIISIPVGAILAHQLYGNKKQTLPILLASTIIWVIIMTFIWDIIIPNSY